MVKVDNFVSGNLDLVRDIVGIRKLKEVSEDFEAIFVNIVLKEMRKSVNEVGFLRGFREDIFRDFLYWEYSKIISRNVKLGISEKVFEVYKENLSI